MPLHLRIEVPDGPGALARVTRTLAAAEAVRREVADLARLVQLAMALVAAGGGSAATATATAARRALSG